MMPRYAFQPLFFIFRTRHFALRRLLFFIDAAAAADAMSPRSFAPALPLRFH